MSAHPNQTNDVMTSRHITVPDGGGRAKGRRERREPVRRARRWTRAMEAPFEVPSRVYREIF